MQRQVLGADRNPNSFDASAIKQLKFVGNGQRTSSGVQVKKPVTTRILNNENHSLPTNSVVNVASDSGGKILVLVIICTCQTVEILVPELCRRMILQVPKKEAKT